MCKIGELSNSYRCPDCDTFTLERLSLKKDHKLNLLKHDNIQPDKQKKRYTCQDCGLEWILTSSILGTVLIELEEIVEI